LLTKSVEKERLLAVYFFHLCTDCTDPPCFSFAGLLPLTFANSSDYDNILPDDKLSLLGLKDLAPGKVFWLTLSFKGRLVHSRYSWVWGKGLEGGRLDFIEACGKSWECSARFNVNPILSHPENSQKATGYSLCYIWLKSFKVKLLRFTHFCSGFLFIAFILISNRTRVAHFTDFKVTRIALHSVQITIIIFWVSCVCICVCSLWLRIVFSLVLKRLYHLLGTIVFFFFCLSAC